MQILSTITTPRLLLRQPDPAYAAEFAALINANLAHLRPWMAWAHQPRSTEAQAELLTKAQARFLACEDLMYLVMLGGQVIGACGLHNLDWDLPGGELGYWLGAEHEGHGYATEAAQALTELALGTLGFERLEIRCDARNARSAAIPRRLGFEEEACLKRSRRTPGKARGLRDTLIFARWKEKSAE